jgi:hypothetical protein
MSTWRVATPARVGGEGLLGDVEGAVNDASDVDLEDGEPEGPGSAAR